MLSFIPRPACLVLALLLASPIVLCADAPSSPEKLVYVKPDSVPAAKTRVKGTGRGGHVPPGVALLILSPEHLGLTIQEHPSIFWYLNQPVKGAKYQLNIIKDGDIDPIVEQQLDPEKVTGIQRLNLADLSKGLEAGAEYQVSIAIIPDANQRSEDVVASARIKRVPATEKLLSKLLTRSTPGDRAVVYAKQGLWYDALAAISDQIVKEPNNKQLHKERAELLKQVDLGEAATYEATLGT